MTFWSSSCAMFGLPSKFAAIGEMNKLPDTKMVFVIKEQDYKIENCKQKIEIDGVGIRDSIGRYSYYFFGSAKNKEIVFLSLRYKLNKEIEKWFHQVVTLRSKDHSCTLSVGTIVQPLMPENLFASFLPKKCNGEKEVSTTKECEKKHMEADANIDNFVNLFENTASIKLTKMNKSLIYDYDPDGDYLLKEYYEKSNVTFTSRGQPIMNEKSMADLKNYLNMTGIEISNKPFK